MAVFRVVEGEYFDLLGGCRDLGMIDFEGGPLENDEKRPDRIIDRDPLKSPGEFADPGDNDGRHRGPKDSPRSFQEGRQDMPRRAKDKKTCPSRRLRDLPASAIRAPW